MPLLCFQVPINDTNTQFVEQTIAIMKNLLDNHTEGSSEHLGQASIETMMLNLVRSVSFFRPEGTVDRSSPVSVQSTDIQYHITSSTALLLLLK